MVPQEILLLNCNIYQFQFQDIFRVQEQSNTTSYKENSYFYHHSKSYIILMKIYNEKYIEKTAFLDSYNFRIIINKRKMGVKFTGSYFEIYVVAFLTYVSHRNLLRMGQICSHTLSLCPPRCIFHHFHMDFVVHNNLPCLLELPVKTKKS